MCNIAAISCMGLGFKLAGWMSSTGKKRSQINFRLHNWLRPSYLVLNIQHTVLDMVVSINYQKFIWRVFFLWSLHMPSKWSSPNQRSLPREKKWSDNISGNMRLLHYATGLGGGCSHGRAPPPRWAFAFYTGVKLIFESTIDWDHHIWYWTCDILYQYRDLNQFNCGIKNWFDAFFPCVCSGLKPPKKSQYTPHIM